MFRYTRQLMLQTLTAIMCFIFSSLAWKSLWLSIHDLTMNRWVIPFLLFSLAIVFFSLFVVINNKKLLAIAISVALLIPSIFFSYGPIFISLLLLSAVVVYAGADHLKDELKSRLKISLFRSLRSSLPLVTLGVGLAVCGFYYDQISGMPGETLVPRMRMGQQMNVVISRILETVHPGFRRMGDSTTTVDQFLEGFQGENKDMNASDLVSSMGINPNSVDLEAVEREMANRPQMQQAALREARKNLSGIVGKDLSGDERIAAVMEDMVNNKIRMFFLSEKSPDDSGTLPLFLTLLLFFTIMPVAALLRFIWILSVVGLFRLAVLLGCARIVQVTREVEIISDGSEESIGSSGVIQTAKVTVSPPFI